MTAPRAIRRAGVWSCAIVVVGAGVLPAALMRHDYWRNPSTTSVLLAIFAIIGGVFGGMIVLAEGRVSIIGECSGWRGAALLALVLAPLMTWLAPSSRPVDLKEIVGVTVFFVILAGVQAIAEEWCQRISVVLGEQLRSSWTRLVVKHRALSAGVMMFASAGLFALGEATKSTEVRIAAAILFLMAWGPVLGVDPQAGYFGELSRSLSEMYERWPGVFTILAILCGIVILSLVCILIMVAR